MCCLKYSTVILTQQGFMVEGGSGVFGVCGTWLRMTPSQCQVEVDPLSLIGSKHSRQKDVDEDSFTQCPGEGGQEDVVQQGCHNLAGILVKRRICM